MAGRVSDRQKREIVEQTDMLAVVGEVVDLRRAGTSYKGLCPFHAEKSPSFHVHPGRKAYHCFGCGAGGDAITFVRETRGLTFTEALEHLAERLGIRLEREQVSPELQRREEQERSARGRLLGLMRCAQDWFYARLGQPEGREAQQYAERRGLTAEIAERFGLGAASTGWTDLAQHLARHGFTEPELVHAGLCVPRESGGVYDKFRDRLMFPIQDAAGDVVGFGGRTLSADKDIAKYMNSPEITVPGSDPGSRFHHFYRKGQVVFGLWQAREGIRRTKMAVVVEGNLDVITLHQAGLNNAVAPMGTALTDGQAALLRRFADKVALVFDGDKAGREAAKKAVPVCLAAGLDGVYVLLPDGEDPDSFVRKSGAEALQARIDKAPHMLNGYIDALVAEAGQSLQARALVVQKAGPLLSAVHDPIARDLARDYLLARLADEQAARATIERHLAQIPAMAMATLPTVPDPTLDEDEVPKLEQDFAAVLVWYPGLLRVAEQAGALDHLQHAGMRLALRDLCAASRDGELQTDAVGHWAHALPDGRARRCVLRWLIEPPLVSADRAEAWLDQTLARLHERWLRDEQARIKREMNHPGLAFDQVRQLMAEKVRVDETIMRLQKDIQAWTRRAAH